MSDKKIGYKDVLRQKEYVKLIMANVINRFGDSIDAIAFEWLIYVLTGSASWAAIIFGVNKIPTIFLQPIAGAAVERRNKKVLMILTDLIRGISVTFIAISYWKGVLTPWMLLGITMVISSAEAFRLPCSSAVVVKLLNKETLDYGVSLNSSISTVVEMVGLAIAGGIIATFGVATAIGVDAVTFFASALVILTINIREEKKASVEKSESYIEVLKDGGKYVLSNKLIFRFILLGVIVNAMFVPLNSLQAPMVSEVLKSDAIMLSVFSIALTVGMLLSTIIYPIVASKFSGKKIIAIVGIVFGAYHIVLPVIGNMIESAIVKYVVVAGLSAITGAVIAFLSAYVNVTFLKIVKEEYISRTAAILNSAGAAAVPIVSFIISIVTAKVSTSRIFIITGVLLIVVLCVMACIFNDSVEEETIQNLDESDIEESEIA